jgi:hypothetical protein
VLAFVVFFVTWAAVAAKPWATTKPDPRIAALAQREQRLRADAKLVEQVVAQRMAAYQTALKQRRAQIAQVQARSLQAAQAPATAASVRVVQLPPLTVTRSSCCCAALPGDGHRRELLLMPPGERAERALDRAEAEFERLEQVLSRFCRF